MRVSIERNRYGMAGAAIVGMYERGRIAGRPQPGQCVWDDGSVGSGEPNRFCLGINEESLVPSGAFEALAALSAPSNIRFHVYNNGNGCMLVTRIDQPTSPRRGQDVTFSAIRDAFGGKADGTVNP